MLVSIRILYCQGNHLLVGADMRYHSEDSNAPGRTYRDFPPVPQAPNLHNRAPGSPTSELYLGHGPVVDPRVAIRLLDDIPSPRGATDHPASLNTRGREHVRAKFRVLDMVSVPTFHGFAS